MKKLILILFLAVGLLQSTPAGITTSPSSGLSTTQVQALIDAAVAGKGVIGTAVLAITSDTVTVTFANGVLTETTGATYGYLDSSGRLTVTFTEPQVDAFYIPSFTAVGGGPLFQKLRSTTSDSMFQLEFATIAGVAAVGGSDISEVRLIVSRLSQ